MKVELDIDEMDDGGMMITVNHLNGYRELTLVVPKDRAAMYFVSEDTQAINQPLTGLVTENAGLIGLWHWMLGATCNVAKAGLELPTHTKEIT